MRYKKNKKKPPEGQANLADEFANHAVPGAVGERRAVLPVSNLVHVILEAQDLGQGVQDIDGEAFVSLGLAQNVLRHHHERLLLSEQSDQAGVISPKLSFENLRERAAREYFIHVESLINVNCNLPRGPTAQPGEETFTHIRMFKGDTFMKSSSGDPQRETLS